MAECEGAGVGKTEQRGVQPVLLRPDPLLHRPLDAEYVKRLDEQVHQDEEGSIEEEFTVHVVVIGDW